MSENHIRFSWTYLSFYITPKRTESIGMRLVEKPISLNLNY